MRKVESLVIVKTNRTGTINAIAQALASHDMFGLGNYIPQRLIPHQPKVIEQFRRPDKAFAHLFPHKAGRHDVAAIKDAVVPYLDGTQLGKSTVWHEGDFKVAVRVEHVDKNGRVRKVKERPLKKWEDSVAKRIRKDARKGNKEVVRLIESVAQPALVVENAGYKARVALDANEAIHPSVLEDSLGGGTKRTKRELKAGHFQSNLDRNVYHTYARLEDGIGDPFNRIHGSAEAIIQLQRSLADKSFADLAMRALFVRFPRINTVVNRDLETLNKFTSRDPLGTKIAVFAYAEAYTRVINHKIFNPKTENSFLQAVAFIAKTQLLKLIPSPTQFDAALDRRTTRQDLVTLATHQKMLTDYNPQSSVMQKHKFDTAQAVVSALGDPRNVTDKIALKISNATVGLDRKSVDAVKALVNKVPGPIKGLLGKFVDFEGLFSKQQAATAQAEKMADDILHSSTSLIDYQRKLLAQTDAMMQIPGLKEIEVLRVKQAKELAERIIATYEVAQRVLSADGDQRRSSATA